MALTTAELFKKARKLEITARRLVDDQLAGQYHSVFKGRGLVFSDVRPYEAGDDVRAIDWNITARMNAPHVKQFVEERDQDGQRLRIDNERVGRVPDRAADPARSASWRRSWRRSSRSRRSRTTIASGCTS